MGHWFSLGGKKSAIFMKISMEFKYLASYNSVIEGKSFPVYF